MSIGLGFLRVRPSARSLPGCAACLLIGWVVGASRAQASDRPAPDRAAGRAAYEQQCARCHGETGKGDGVDATRFYPRPRDLAMGVYKFRSTASGTPPTDEDLFDTITNGLPGSNMPDWHQLSEATRWQLVYYLKSLSPVFEQSQPEPIQTAADPGSGGADLAKGKVVFDQLKCAACHGAPGRGDGASAAGLVDDWGMPIRPANLTQGWSYRGGSDPRAIMLRMLAGIDGTGMPSYAGAVSPEDAWHLAYYVASLQEPAHWNLIGRAELLDGPLPESPDDPRWERAEPTDVRLRNAVEATGEWAHPPTIRAVSFRALCNREAVAFHIWWDDPTQDPQDALAIVLRTAPANGGPSPGQASSQGDVVSLQAWPYDGAAALDFCYWSPNAAMVETVATAYEQLTVPQRAVAGLSSAVRYVQGRWHLIVQRPLEPEQPAGAASMAHGTLVPVAFVAWDGGNPPARAISPWVDVQMGPSADRDATGSH